MAVVFSIGNFIRIFLTVFLVVQVIRGIIFFVRYNTECFWCGIEEEDKDFVKIPSEPVEPVALDNAEDLYNPPQIGFKIEPVDDD